MFLVETDSPIDRGEVTVWHAGTPARRLRVASVQPRTLPDRAAPRPRLVLRSACRCLTVVLALAAAHTVARGEVTISNGRGPGSLSISSYHFTPVSGAFGLGCGPTEVRADLDNGVRIAHLQARGETATPGATCTHFPDGSFTGDATSASVSLRMSGSVEEVWQDTWADLGAHGGLRISGGGMKRYTLTIVDTAPPDEFSLQTTRTVWNRSEKIYARSSNQNVGNTTIVIEDFILDLWVDATGSVSTTSNPPRVPKSIDVALIVTVAIEDLCPPNNMFTWNQPSGGAYSDAANWDPECDAPPRVEFERSDTAVFGLGGTAGIISIDAGGATAGRWIVADTIETSGLARLLGSSQTEPSLTVRGGGSLSIGDGAIESIHADIGEGNLQGRVTVGGYRAGWMNSGLIRVGGLPSAGLDVLLGGHVETADLEVGTRSGSTGAVEVRSVNTSSTRETLLKVNGTLTISDSQGAGNLLISDGGRVEANDLVIKDKSDNGGDSIVISGISGERRSTLQVNGNLNMWGTGPTRLEVKDGASLQTTGPVSIVTGSVLVNNTASGLPPLDMVTGSGGASWTAGGPINIGTLSGELIVEDGGVVIGSHMNVGDQGGPGRVTVSDSGSLVFLGDLLVGAAGEGTMEVSGGARVDSGPSTVGGAATGSVTINGVVSASEWRVRGDLNVGTGVANGIINLNDRLPLIGDARLSVAGTLTIGSNGAILGNGPLTSWRRTASSTAGSSPPACRPARPPLKATTSSGKGARWSSRWLVWSRASSTCSRSPATRRWPARCRSSSSTDMCPTRATRSIACRSAERPPAN